MPKEDLSISVVISGCSLACARVFVYACVFGGLCNTASRTCTYMGSRKTRCVPALYLFWPPKLEQHSQMKPVTPPEGAGTLTKEKLRVHTVWHDSQVNLARALFNCAVSEGLMRRLHVSSCNRHTFTATQSERSNQLSLARMNVTVPFNAFTASCAMLFNKKPLLRLTPDVRRIYQYVKDTVLFERS